MSQSNPNLSIKKSALLQSRGSTLPTIPLSKITPGGNQKVTEKGDAGTGLKLEILRDKLRPVSAVRKQYSAPALNQAALHKPLKQKTDATRRDETISECTSPRYSTTAFTLKSSSSVVSIESEPISEFLLKDPKLNALCTAIGIGSNPNTLVGPIEKGLLIIGTLQDSLTDLLKLKMKNAAKKGQKFHIQQSGLDVAVRALENAERSLKTMKVIKEPVFGRARQQRSSDFLPQTHKTTEAVIRILTTTKEKFDKMEMNWMSSISFFPSTASTVPASTSRRSTGSSLQTPVTPHNTTAPCSRARTSGSTTSICSRNGRGKLISIM